MLMRFPDQHFSVIVLANAADFNPGNIAQKVAEVYLESKMDPVKSGPDAKDKAKQANVDPKVLDRYVGDYSFDVGFILTIRRDGDKLVAQTPQSVRPLVTLSETEFLDKEGNWRLTFAKSTGKDQWRLAMENDGNVLHGDRAEKVASTGAELKEMVGDFYSEELDIVYHVALKDGELMLRHRKGEVPLRQSATDKFTCSLGGLSTLEIRRNGSKGVSGFTIGTPSCRAIRFVRVEVGK
jgi:hypothetical protein